MSVILTGAAQSSLVSEKNAAESVCPLCGSSRLTDFFQDAHRNYFRCEGCDLVSVPPGQFLSPEQEKAEYDLHENAPDDLGYRRFLSRLFVPLERRLTAGSLGLDFGSGPGPALPRLLEEAGHEVAIYDYFYAPDTAVLDRQYDFITATEVVEHLHKPHRELDRLWSCLRPGGVLGVMTKLALDRAAFSRWHYKNDLTHVCFYSRQTCEWLAGIWGADLSFEAKDVIFFAKNG